jgi:metabolite-proton symporter
VAILPARPADLPKALDRGRARREDGRAIAAKTSPLTGQPTSSEARRVTAQATESPGVSKRDLVKAVVASTIGTTIEWYDFFLYGTAAIIVFPQLFFPDFPGFAGRLLSLLTFTAGFLARPIGGIVFGYLGDRLGRKSSLVITLVLMGASTLLIGFLPGHEQIGVAAPLLLTFLRILQGVGVGGEWGGAVLLALESGHRGRRGFYASWPQAGVPLGLLTSSAVFALCRVATTEEAFLAWGWRIPFFLSGLLIVVGLVIRAQVSETPLFAQLQQARQVSQAPIREAIHRYWRQILLAAGARVSENSCFYLFSVYVLAYGKDRLGLKTDDLLQLAVTVAAALEFFTIPLFGLLSDRWSRKGTFVAGSLFLLVFALPYLALLETRQPVWVMTAVVLSLAVGHAMLYGVQASLIPELFATRLRYTGSSLGYQFAAPFAGGLAPIVAAWLVKAFPDDYWPLGQYIILLLVLSLACVLGLAETSRKDISAPEEHGPSG